MIAAATEQLFSGGVSNGQDMIADELFTPRINIIALFTGLAAMISIDLCRHYERLLVCVIGPQSALIPP